MQVQAGEPILWQHSVYQTNMRPQWPWILTIGWRWVQNSDPELGDWKKSFKTLPWYRTTTDVCKPPKKSHLRAMKTSSDLNDLVYPFSVNSLQVNLSRKSKSCKQKVTEKLNENLKETKCFKTNSEVFLSLSSKNCNFIWTDPTTRNNFDTFPHI